MRTHLTLEEHINSYLNGLSGQNYSEATIIAYRRDLLQFVIWLKENNLASEDPTFIVRDDISDFLATLRQQGKSGATGARKLAALREFFAYLVTNELLTKSPADSVPTPKQENRVRQALTPSEYKSVLSEAGEEPRDYAVIQLFLQTGVRVSELVCLELDDIDFAANELLVRWGKGKSQRVIPLASKAAKALKTYIDKHRPIAPTNRVFLNRFGNSISARGVQNIIAKYRERVGITKQFTPHTLRHTFGTSKNERGVSPFQLKEWMGHKRIDTTMRYVHPSREFSRRVMEQTSL